MWKEVYSCLSVYAPQQGRSDEEKREFLEKLSDNIHDAPQEDLLMVGGDITCHIGSTRDGLTMWWDVSILE